MSKFNVLQYGDENGFGSIVEVVTLFKTRTYSPVWFGESIYWTCLQNGKSYDSLFFFGRRLRDFYKACYNAINNKKFVILEE